MKIQKFIINMNKKNLIEKAIEIANSGLIKGFTSDIIKKAANHDVELFLDYLENISEQAWDPETEKLTVHTYSQELVDISKELFPKKNDYPMIDINESKIKGGIADKLNLKKIADKFGIDISKLKKELEMGKKVEMEHTNDKSAAKDIAMDHLAEIPDYYTLLKRLEDKALKKWKDKEKK